MYAFLPIAEFSLGKWLNPALFGRKTDASTYFDKLSNRAQHK